ncbi:MAG: DUF86 domain-containing protein [Planctomycetes bacterium]|nr:DUF86 domain-containing protein [Planctomycetota bacterium]
MPRREPLAFLSDAISACEIIVRHAEELTPESYERDLARRSIIERHFLIVGEAVNQASRLRPDLKDRVTGFAGIVGLRNLLAHGYFMIDAATVLAICRDDVPVLLAELRTIAGPLPPPGDAARTADSPDRS